MKPGMTELEVAAERIVYTGMIDEYYDYCFGELEYRSLTFETEVLDVENYQGNAVVNYTEYEIPYTRIIEHKHFEFQCQDGTNNPKTVITREYPLTWQHGDEPYYPMNDEKNNEIYAKYFISNPARSCVQAILPKEAKVEVEVIAYKK